MSQLERKRPKMVIYMLHSVKKKISNSKSQSLIEAHDQKNFSRSEKISSYGNFNLSRLGQNVVWTKSTFG